MEKFNREAACPKCGDKHIRTVHVARQSLGVVGKMHMTSGEAMRRTCQLCSFSWAEAPLDAPTLTESNTAP